MPTFQDLKSKNGLKELNCWLESRSYIEGYAPTKNDADVYSKVGSAPAAEFPHVVRWYNHIGSYTNDQRSKFGTDSKIVSGASTSGTCSATAAKPAAKQDEDDDVDLFGDSGDEQEDAEKERLKQERLKAYADKKSKKPGPIAKSNVIFDVKPWDDETDLKEMEKLIRQISCDGLIWGPSKTMPVAYGINKIQIGCVIEDDKVSVDWLEEQLTGIEDLVQSVDIAAFNKI